MTQPVPDTAPAPAATQAAAQAAAWADAAAAGMPGLPVAPGPVLAPWACHPHASRGRRHAEAASPGRNVHQRDRDRIIHSSAFRRLVYKTQVFVNHEGDLFRTRLTHSLEVAQVGRTIARALALNEDLVEAICLAHDLGHTPFGHVGQDALNACMCDFGGFEHNLQSLRVVDVLEERYPEFDGLNLSFETREGILKHCSRRSAEKLLRDEPDGVAVRFIRGGQPSLEAQIANLADAVAYNTHDVDDGLRAGLLQLSQLQELPLFAESQAWLLQRHPQLAQPAMQRRRIYGSLRHMLSRQIADVVQHSAQLVRHSGVDSVQAVRAWAQPLVRLSQPMQAQAVALKRFLHRHLYEHPQVAGTMQAAHRIVCDLFAYYQQHSQHMHPRYARRAAQAADAAQHARVVADFIAGMTDRFALQAHERITATRLLP